MAVDTFVVYVGVYGNQADAEEDYETVKTLHVEAGLLDADRKQVFGVQPGQDAGAHKRRLPGASRTG